MSLSVVYNSAMEFANDETQLLGNFDHVRCAKRNDARAITSLLQNAPHRHIHADWHYPVDWLGSPGFMLIDDKNATLNSEPMTRRVFGSPARVAACLAVAADPPPAAWVRIAAVSEKVDAQKALAAMFNAVHKYMRKSAVSQVGWLTVESWPTSWIRSLGFEQINSVGTFMKVGTESPSCRMIPNLRIRPVSTGDLELLARIDSNAFPSLWRNSEDGLAVARRHTFSFDVVEYEDRLVAYQCSTLLQKRAHLSRIVVDPSVQGKGVGSILLAHAMKAYRQRGVDQVSLNTQLDNLSSKRLYERFGFELTGQKFPVWGIQYEAA